MLFDPYLRAPQTSRQEMAELAKAAEAKAEVSEGVASSARPAANSGETQNEIFRFNQQKKAELSPSRNWS